MNARVLLALQFTTLIIMLGCADAVFLELIQTIMFVVSFFAFAYCSIYISNNEKRLLKELE